MGKQYFKETENSKAGSVCEVWVQGFTHSRCLVNRALDIYSSKDYSDMGIKEWREAED